MGRTSTIWQRKRDGAWMTTIQGKQVKLSMDKAEARKVFYRLMGQEKKPAAKCSISTRKLCDLYLDRTRDDKEPDTHKVQLWHLKGFCETFGTRNPSTIKVHEVSDWLDGQDTLGPSIKALTITILKAAFNWAAAQGYLEESPIKKLKRRKTKRRERVRTADERERIRAAVSPAFADYLFFIEETGCRPYSEAAKLTAADIDFANGRAVLKRHKNAKKGKTRIVYFAPKLLARLKELAEEHPTGLLFRNRLGQEWVKENVTHYTRRVYRKLEIEPFTPYAYRHSYISNALVKGVPVEMVAELVGSSPKVIHSNYAHLCKMPDALRAAAEKAVT